MQDASNEVPLTQEERERIRLKRLERLQASMNTQPPQQQQQQPQQKQQQQNLIRSEQSSSSSSAVQSPVSQKAQLEAPSRPMTTQPKSPSPSIPSTPRQPTLTFEAWQNEALSRILQVSLNKHAAAPLLFLSSLAEELNNENEPLLISQASLDRVLVDRMSVDPNDSSNASLLDRGQLRLTLFDYLLDCWRRLEMVKSQTSRVKTLPANVIEERVQSLNASKGLLVSYAGLVIQMPDMFPQIQNGTNLGAQQLIDRLLADPDSTSGVPIEFLKDIADRFKDDGLEAITQPLVAGLAARARTATILTDWRTPLRALLTLVDVPAMAASIPQVATWNPANATARQVEIVSALGPFLKTSGFCADDPSVAELFGTGLKRNKSDASGAFASIRGAVRGLHTSLFQGVNGIVRSGAEPRERMLAYFYSVLRKNERRSQMQVDRATVSGDGFIYNITEILMRFCDPFMDSSHSKVDRISQTFFRGHSKIDISKVTRICAPKEVIDGYAGSEAPPGSINFISDIFFLTLGFHHIGVSRMYVDYKRFMKDFYEMRDQYDRLKEQETSGQLSAENGLLIKRYEAQLDKMITFRLSLESQILDPIILGHSFQFYNLVMVWLLRLVDPAQAYPRTPIKLPLPARPSDDFAILPEYIFEDIVEFFIFVLRHSPETVASSTLDELVTFTMVFLTTPGYIKNPHLKAKLVEILFFMTLPYRGQRNDDTLGIKLNTNSMALQCLIPAIMNFYVEVENTGRHSQFYDKFNIRYNISQILKFVWTNPIHRDMVKAESQKSESFVRFANLLMNDTTYLLDEGLSKLAEIHDIEVEMDDKVAWAAQTPQYRQEREGVLSTAQRQASSYIALGNETVNMLSYLTVEIKEPFLTAEIVDRLATMLDYNLVILVGEKMSNLKVKNPEEYRFQPRILLSDIINIYLHLDTPTFIAALARDDRSYSADIFFAASRILEGRNLKSPDEIAKLARLVRKIEDVRQKEAKDEEELGEIPDEFLDPLLYTLMEDPVLLPTSNMSIDRSTIKSHLLSDTTDPFNRMPLKISEVIDNVELRDRIRAWKTSQRSKSTTVMEIDE
ncbi:ubiquitin elongating factor core-domain-containing protein [Linnemannia elongata]|nr:ubiquitin elongating factor core-domain-containing protein [Linnemannia elongata]